jgi:signal transduction histidine kinase/ligand-binding sensor domain-containing protein
VPARQRFALFFAIVLWPAVAAAINPDRGLAECGVDVWRTRDGLPGAWIRGITQTGDGYLWIGTQAGLARYGGGAIVHVAAEHPFEQGADVMGLSVDRDGAVWVMPARGHPLCARGDTLGACFPGGGPLPAESRVASISQDQAGAVWIAAPEGIFRFAGGRLTLARAPSSWGSAPVSAVHHDRGGTLWVGTSRGLFAGPGGAAPAAPLTAQGLAVPVMAIAESPRDGLWVAAERTVLHIAGDRTEVFTARQGLPPARLTTILEDRDGNVWIGSREGLIRFQPGRGAPFQVFTRFDGLPDGDVSALYEDREGTLWVGTRAGGLAQFTDRTLDRRATPPSLLGQWIGSVAEDGEGTLWAATPRGLTRVRAGEERTYTEADGLPSNQVLSVYPGRTGELWVGTDRGLCRFRGGHFEPIAGVTTAVTALDLEPDGTLWIGAAQGLLRLGVEGLQRFALPSEAARTAEEIRAIGRDDGGILWISANGRLLELAGGTLRPDPSPIGAAIGKVRAISRDRDGTLWLGTGDGLIRRRQGRWRLYGAAEGLGRNDLYQVMADDLGFLWAGTSRGLLRVARAALDEVDQGRRRSVDLVSFDIADERREVRVTRTRQPGVWKNGQGRLHFATSRGVTSVDPRRLPVNPLPPPVFIEQALVDGRPARRGAANEFPPGSGAFEFHFAAITLVEPRKAQHRYRLEGFDQGWVEAGARRTAYYTNMQPGHYRFRVQGSNADGIWNQTGDVIELTLAPHLYQTSWFYGLGGLATLGLVVAFHRQRLARLRSHYLATLAERARVAREVHDSLLQGMTATLMHLRGLRKRFAPTAPPASSATIAGEIKAIEEVVATNVEETRQFVWDLRDGKPAPELAPALTELVGRLVGGTVDGRVLVEGTPLALPRHVQRELLRIAHEALANAVKHAGADHLEVRLRYAEATVSLTVADDGRGFDPEGARGVTSGHFGLAGMRERAALLGRFTLETAPGRGTRVEVTADLKDLRDG